MGRTAPAAGALLGVALGVAVCAGPGAFLDPGPVAPPVPLGLDAYVPIPPDNPLTLEGIELGRRLFFDPRLSADGTVSCASCHRPEHAFADTLPVSLGVQGRAGRRNAPSLVNVAWARFLFWDGREESLEEQVLRPVQDPLEMDLSLEELEARLRADRSYRRDFRRTYPDGVTAVNAGRALASFLRTLNSGDAAVDRYRMRGDRDALTPAQLEGLRLFTGRANCAACHLGPNFSDDGFHNTGVAVRSGDPGRYGVTGTEADRGAFRTPRLREVARTAPYMHDGSLASLEEVVEFYAAGGVPNPRLDPEIRPLRLSPDEKRALVAFLEALGGGAGGRGRAGDSCAARLREGGGFSGRCDRSEHAVPPSVSSSPSRSAPRSSNRRYSESAAGRSPAARVLLDEQLPRRSHERGVPCTRAHVRNALRQARIRRRREIGGPDPFQRFTRQHAGVRHRTTALRRFRPRL